MYISHRYHETPATTKEKPLRVERAKVVSYTSSLNEQYRPPSKGGNTGAWHQHVLIIEGERYSFLALGQKKWVFVSDTVSFEWSWDETQKYRNIETDTMRTWDKNGSLIARGDRGTKAWRTAPSRLPARRREWRD